MDDLARPAASGRVTFQVIRAGEGRSRVIGTAARGLVAQGPPRFASGKSWPPATAHPWQRNCVAAHWL